MSGDTLPVDHADDDLGADDLDGTEPFVTDVRVQGAVRVQAVAVDMPVARSITLTTTVETIAPADPRRSRLTLISAVEDFYIGISRGEVDAGTAAIWPAGQPLHIQGRRAIFAKVYAPGRPTATATLSFLVESLG